MGPDIFDLRDPCRAIAPENLRIQRVQKRDKQRTEAEIRAIISKQISEEEKMKLANYVIFNDDKTPVLPQILELDKRFREDN